MKHWARHRAAIGLASVLAGAAGLIALDARSQLRPLVSEMLGNLAQLNEIEEGIALEDYQRVGSAAKVLKARARALKTFDITELGIEKQRGAQFDAYLSAQEQAAATIEEAARRRDAKAVVLGVQRLLGNACLSCHRDFRERQNLLRPPVLFMSTFLNSWKDINRGLVMNDFELVSRRAREIRSLARVLMWDQVIEPTFGITDGDQRKEFRGYLRKVAVQASRIETAATEEKSAEIIESGRVLWTEGCVACHLRFRRGQGER